MRFGNSVAQAPESLISSLKEREDQEGIQNLSEEGFRKGDRVHIVGGVLTGYEAIFQARTSQARVVLLVDIAEKSARLQLDMHDIELIM